MQHGALATGGSYHCAQIDLERQGAVGTVNNEMVFYLPGIESVQYLRLANNDISPWTAPQFTRFVQERCASSGSRCSGVPYAGSSFSCTAFGFMARLKLDVANECDKCDGDQTGTILLILLMVCLMLLGLTAYVIIILKFPEALRRWVSFAIILVNHTQTLSILGSLNLTWPPIVKMILSALTLFQIESATCLLPPNVPSFWLYAFGVLSLSLLTLGLVTLAMTYYDTHGRSDAADRLEFSLTVLFSTLFVYSLQVCSAVLRENLTAEEAYLARIAGALAVPVVILICALVCRFWHKVAAYRRAIDSRGWSEGGWCTSRGRRVYPRSLRQRVFYLTHRFGMHAQRWQFVVWARQLALIILIGVNELLAYNYPVQLKYTRYAMTGVAVVIILVALRWHVKVAPYAYKTQNALESFLMISNVLLLATACVYQSLADIERGLFLPASAATFNVSEYQQNSLVAELRADEVDALVEPPFMGHELPIFVVTEMLMIIFLGLSFLSTGLYVVYDVRAKRRAVEGTDPTLVLTAAEMYFDGPLRTALYDGRLRLVSCDWILSATGGGALTSIRAPDGSGWPLPEEAYLTPEAAVQLLVRGDRSVFMLSYAWETLLSPDPHLRTLRTMRTYLRRQGASGCGLYWDVFSLRENNMQKSIIDDVVSDTDLSQLLCASVTATVVCCVKRPARRLPLELEGHVLVYDYAQHISDKALAIAHKSTEVEEDEVATLSEADKSAPKRRVERNIKPEDVLVNTHAGTLSLVPSTAPASSELPSPMRLCVTAPMENSMNESEELVFMAMFTGTASTLDASNQAMQFGESYRAAFEVAIKPREPLRMQVPFPSPGDLPPPGPTPKMATTTYREKLAVKLAAVRAERAAVVAEETFPPDESAAAEANTVSSLTQLTQPTETVASKATRSPPLMNPIMEGNDDIVDASPDEDEGAVAKMDQPSDSTPRATNDTPQGGSEAEEFVYLAMTSRTASAPPDMPNEDSADDEDELFYLAMTSRTPEASKSSPGVDAAASQAEAAAEAAEPALSLPHNESQALPQPPLPVPLDAVAIQNLPPPPPAVPVDAVEIQGPLHSPSAMAVVVPIPAGSDVAVPSSAGLINAGESIRAWLDAHVKAGFGERFAPAFEALGIEDASDVSMVDDEMLTVLEARLTSEHGAKVMHLRRLRQAMVTAGADVREAVVTPSSTPPPSPPPSPPRKRFVLDPLKAARRATKAAANKAERAEAEEKRAKERAVEQVLRTKFREYGRVVGCSIVGAHVHVRFDSHENALKAVADPKLGCDLVHLDKPYDERGRCIAEEGIARVVIAHLKKSEEIGQLPSRFILAQARRPKLVYVGDDGEAQKCEVDHRPERALAKMRRELEAKSAHFRGKDERDDVLMGVAQMEYLIDRSMDEATQLQQLDRFTISPALIEQLRLISSVEVRPPQGTCPVICIRSPCKSGALITFSGGFEGLHVGDVIVAINGAVVSGQASVVKHIIAQCNKSGAAELTLARRSRHEKIDRGEDSTCLGVSLCASPRGIGALVCKVRPGSLAEKHDVRQGDTILSVNETIGESPERVLALIQSDQVAELVLERFTKDISFLKAHLVSKSTDEDGDVEAARLDATPLDDDIITLEGVAKHRRKRLGSATQTIKRANFLLHVQVGDAHSAYVNNELSGKQLTMALSLLVRWALDFFKEGRGPSGPFAPLAAIDTEQLVRENTLLKVLADSTEVADMAEVQPIALVKSAYKPVRIDIHLVDPRRVSPTYRGVSRPVASRAAPLSAAQPSQMDATEPKRATADSTEPKRDDFMGVDGFDSAGYENAHAAWRRRNHSLADAAASAPPTIPVSGVTAAVHEQSEPLAQAPAKPAFPVGARVLVQRSDGSDHLGTVDKHDPNRGRYKVVFDDGRSKIVQATELRAAPENVESQVLSA